MCIRTPVRYFQSSKSAIDTFSLRARSVNGMSSLLLRPWLLLVSCWMGSAISVNKQATLHQK